MWVASVDFREDMVGSEALMQRVSESYRKIRNTFRYILGNLYDFEPAKDAVPYDQLEALDRYALQLTSELSRDVQRWYEEFEFHRIYQRASAFGIVDLSAFYFDVLKDRLYTSAPNSPARRSAQTAIWRIGDTLARLLAPIMSFTSEEIWQHLPAMSGRSDSVHVARFPVAEEILGGGAGDGDASLSTDWAALRAVRDEVLKALEEARNNKLIGTPLEAQLALTAPEPLFALLTRYKEQLRYLFIVSAVSLAPGSGDGTGSVQVEVRKADGLKCDRCWNYSTRVGEDANYPTVCERCSAVLKEIEEAAAQG